MQMSRVFFWSNT